ncbi:acetate--CoA ligase family protein [Pararhodobacter zhoushanensis]|uniref:Acetate--CoA ligase family protein n=1 Tax=Pararhodobacter zhoushanensis TaxID=2479545 RepID=A0ABT3GU04_9RHOB|nr:acetate--CoA ligase family protein [Pararhodobacter zhoushanensis]MCW1930997.1 acetate--CoA ligase family protein [Pararhodobacter zhoushanensis]
MRRYEADGFLVFEDGSALAHALGALTRFRDAFARRDLPPAPMQPLDLPQGPLSEARAKALLARAGIRFAGEHLAATAGCAARLAPALGFPVVVKICSPDIPHKTEIGGVAVNLHDEEAVRQAATEILARAATAMPDARIEGVLVAPMVQGGVETIVGVTRDPVLGPVVMFGLGGVFVEVLKDVTFRAAPFGLAEAHRMIREIRGFALLEGVRGAPPSDIDALAQLLTDLSRFAAAHAAQVIGVDLNPVRVMPKGQGVIALDALIELEGQP